MCHATLEQTTCSAPECNRPIYVERNGTRHPFCGRTCASQYGGYTYKNDPFISRAEICRRAGCNNSTFVEANGRVHPYCGRTCAHHDTASRMNSRPLTAFNDLDLTNGFDPPPAYLPFSNNNNNNNVRYFPNSSCNSSASNLSSNSTIVSPDSSEDYVDVQNELFT